MPKISDSNLYQSHITMLDTGNSAGYPLRTVLIVALGNNAHRAKEEDHGKSRKEVGSQKRSAY